MSETVTQLKESEFEKEVVGSQIPVVVDFYADWCGPCRLISPVLEKLSQEYVGKAKFVKIDTDQNQDLAMKFGIMSIPTVMFYKEGKVKDLVIGAAPAAVFKSKLDSLVSGQMTA